MNKQNKMVIIRIDEILKDKFTKKANENHMKLSGRLKYLMKMDIDGRLRID